MRKLRAFAAITAIVGGTLIAGATPAHAESDIARCGTLAGQYTLSGLADYTTLGATQHWYYAEWYLMGATSRPHNNTNLRLRSSPDRSHSTNHRTYFSYDSPDDLLQFTPYRTEIDTNVPASENVYLKFDAIFDLPGDDPHCEAYTQFV